MFQDGHPALAEQFIAPDDRALDGLKMEVDVRDVLADNLYFVPVVEPEAKLLRALDELHRPWVIVPSKSDG